RQMHIMHDVSQGVTRFKQAGALNENDGFLAAHEEAGRDAERFSLAAHPDQGQAIRTGEGGFPLPEGGVRYPEHMAHATLFECRDQFGTGDHIPFLIGVRRSSPLWMGLTSKAATNAALQNLSFLVHLHRSLGPLLDIV